MVAEPETAVTLLDWMALAHTPVAQVPYQHLVIRHFVPQPAAAAARLDFPLSAHGGVAPARAKADGDGFDRLLTALRDPVFTTAMGDRFGVPLDPDALMITLRSRVRPQDGRIHVDSTDKVVTALIYLNDSWPHPGGMLRILRGPDDIDDYVAEVPPLDGTLLAFRRSETSFHGHLPHDGVRRAIMLNWMTGPGAARRETMRHELSAAAKRFSGLIES